MEDQALQEVVRFSMMSDGTISIFSGAADFGQRPVPVVASILIHGLAIGIISFGIMYAPTIVKPQHIEQFSIRNLDFPIPEAQMRRLPGQAADQGSQRSDASIREAAEKLAEYIQSQHPIAHANTGPHILRQADLRPRPDISVEIQVPTFVIWKPSKVRTKTIVAPPPEKPHAAEVTPSISAPNEELELNDIAITASDFPTTSIQTLAATTSPAVVHEPDATQKVPVTVAQISDKPTPAAVMSVSDLRVADRKSVLPPVNETAGLKAQGGSAPDEAKSPGGSKTAIDTKAISPQAENHSGTGAGKTSSGRGSADRPTVQDRETKGASGEGRPGSSSQGNNAVFNQENHAASVITLAKDGHFGSVVVGISLQDRFPELEGLWSGRLIYMVYLHVGLAHSWILEYSLPRSAEAAAAGNVAHLEAPWPYSIVRPDLAPGSMGADALIVNGFINKDGRFETLNLITPPSYPLSDFVLHCLQQWHFRPAVQDGHPTRVEVMLVIPDQAE